MSRVDEVNGANEKSYADRLRVFAAKAKMLGVGEFIMDYENGILLSYKGKQRNLVLPPVRRIASNAISGQLDTLELPNTLEVIDNNALSIDGIKELVLPNSLTYLSPNFMLCVTLRKLHIGSKLSQIRNLDNFQNLEWIEVDPANPFMSSNDGILYNKGQSLMFFCPEARTKDVILPNTIEELAPKSFSGCSIRHVKLPEHLEIIPEFAFAHSNILTMELPSNLVSIERMAFYACNKLRSVCCNGNHLRRIDDSAFANCSNLRMINLGIMPKQIADNAFENDNLINTFIV